MLQISEVHHFRDFDESVFYHGNIIHVTNRISIHSNTCLFV